MHQRDLRDPAEIEQWAERWDRLAIEAGALYFRSPAWASSWWRSFEPNSHMTLLVDGSIDEPIGLFALSALRRRVHPRIPVAIPYVGVAGSGLGAADDLGPVTSDDACTERLLRAALEFAGSRPLVLDSIGPTAAAPAGRLPGAVELTSNSRPGVELADVDRVEDLWSPKVRKNVARRERQLEEGGFRRRWIRLGPDSTDELLHLERLHNDLWASRGSTGLFGVQRMAFFVDLARRTPSSGCDGPWLQLIENDDRVVGALLGFRYGRTFSSYKTGWDPSLPQFGLGVQLHGAAIRWAHGAGLARYDFLRGPRGHKYSLGGEDAIDRTFMVPTGVRGRQLLLRDRLSLRRRSTLSP